MLNAFKLNMCNLTYSKLKSAIQFGLVFVIAGLLGACTTSDKPMEPLDEFQNERSPDILILGDSQISYGAGDIYTKMFSNLHNYCPRVGNSARLVDRLGHQRTLTLGVRSTSLHHWVDPKNGKTKGTICTKDKKWGVNAGIWGLNGNYNRKYVQVGEGRDLKICKPEKSAFEGMFENGYYKPKLLILAFLGNSADRWAKSREAAMVDVDRTINQIPNGVPCVFMTTAPTYLKATNNKRQKAQENIAYAFSRHAKSCSFVGGFDQQTRAAAEGNKAFFKTNKSGKVLDTNHPNLAASTKYLELKMPQICNAIEQEMLK